MYMYIITSLQFACDMQLLVFYGKMGLTLSVAMGHMRENKIPIWFGHFAAKPSDASGLQLQPKLLKNLIIGKLWQC